MAILTKLMSVRIYLCAMILLFICNGISVQAVDCYTEVDPYYWGIDVGSLIHIATPQDAEDVRNDIIDYFWPNGGFPYNKMPASVTTLTSSGSNWPDYENVSLPTNGLVGHWKFDGNLFDATGNGNLGVVLTGTVGYSTGLDGSAIQFDGSDAVSVPITAGSDWTIMCWVKGTTGNDGMFWATGYDYYGDGGQGWESIFNRLYDGGNSITGAIDWPKWNDLGLDGHMAGANIAAEQWHHVAVCYEGGTGDWVYYVDGKVADTGTVPFPGWMNNKLTLGGAYGTSGLVYSFSGLMEDMRLYNRVVSEEEIIIPGAELIRPAWIDAIGSSNIGQVDRIDVEMDYKMHSYAYHLHPETGSVNRLLIFHMGHSSDMLAGGGGATMKYFLDRGYDIIAFWMPLYAENSTTAYNVPGYGTYTFSSHDSMTVLENSDGCFIRFFVEPVFFVINYVESMYNYIDINMTGISGGGWSTHICAAIDPRIKLSFPTAGSLPLYLREGPCWNGSAGDAEQVWAGLFENTASWLDFYILGGYGIGRGEIQVLNQYDSCCFWGVNYQTYETLVADRVNLLGEGFFDVYLDSSHHDHQISDVVIEQIIDSNLISHLPVTGDLNGDMFVDISDFAILAANWLQCSYINDNCP